MIGLPTLPALPNPAARLVNTDGTMNRIWFTYFRALDQYLRQLGGPLPSYTVAGLPASVVGETVYVSDGTSNKRFAVGDGTNWRFPDGNIVS